MSYDAPPPPPPQQPGGYGGGYGGQPKNSGKAITAMILGIVSIFPCCTIGVIPGAIAVFLARSASGEIASANGALTGAGMAKAGLITGIIGIVLCIVYWVLALAFGQWNFYVNTSP